MFLPNCSVILFPNPSPHTYTNTSCSCCPEFHPLTSPLALYFDCELAHLLSLPCIDTDDYPACFSGSSLSYGPKLHRHLPFSPEFPVLENNAKPIRSSKLESSDPAFSPIPYTQLTQKVFRFCILNRSQIHCLFFIFIGFQIIVI